jgi:hypothetical protein
MQLNCAIFGFNIVQYCRQLSTFQMNLLPPCSELMMAAAGSSEMLLVSMRLHSVATDKTKI